MAKATPDPRQKLLTAKEWRRFLESDGWTAVTKGGGHQVQMRKPGRRPIPLPENKRQPYGKGLHARLLREYEGRG